MLKYRDRNKDRKKAKESDPVIVFVKTFVAAFLIITVVLTPVFAMINSVNELLDSTPGGDDIPILEQELDYLISPDNPFFDAFTTANRVNILLIGVDHHNLTDTIMLASYDLDLKYIDLISIPRDTYYYRGPNYIDDAHHKINAVYMRNPVNTAKAVSEILMDIPINYYVQISYEGVANIVESMGGVPMDIPFHMRYDDPYDRPPLRIDIPAGPQTLNGEQSVQFLRFRTGNSGYRGYPEGDLERVRVQQQFMKSALRQCLTFDLPTIISTAYDNVQSDITMRTALYLATRAVGMSADDITTYTLPNRYLGAFVRPDMEGIAAMLTEIYTRGNAPDPSDTGDIYYIKPH